MKGTKPDQIVAVLYFNKVKRIKRSVDEAISPQSISSDLDDDEEGSESESEDFKRTSLIIKRKYLKNEQKEDELRVSQEYEFFDKDQLIQFLYNKKDTATDGVLQKFVSPKESEKSTLSIIWSNKL